MSRGEKSIQGQQFSFHFINKRHYSLYSSISISIYESFAPNGAAQHHPLYVYDCWWYGKIRKRKGHEHHRLFSSNIAHNSSFIFSYIFLNRTQKKLAGNEWDHLPKTHQRHKWESERGKSHYCKPQNKFTPFLSQYFFSLLALRESPLTIETAHIQKIFI